MGSSGIEITGNRFTILYYLLAAALLLSTSACSVIAVEQKEDIPSILYILMKLLLRLLS